MTLALGVIGTGAIGRDHIRRCTAALAGATVVAATDIDPNAARAALDAHAPAAAVHVDGLALVRDPAVEAVIVASSGPTHAAYVLAAIEAGKPVFCEKPLATTAADCRRIVDAEIAAGRRLVQVGFMRPYDPGYRALKKVIDDGTIGVPLMIHAAHRNAAVPAHYSTDMAITDTLIHELNVLSWLVGEPFVSAQVLFPRRSARALPHLRDPQIVLLETAGGIRVDTEIFVNCTYGYDIQCEVVGELGTARLPEPSAIPLRTNARLSTELLVSWKDRFIGAYDIELQDFIDRYPCPAGPSAWDGYTAALAADACVRAQETGAVEPIEQEARPAFYG